MPPGGPAAPIKRLWRKATAAGAPAIAIALADPPRHLAGAWLVGRGVDEDPELAERKAMMEVLERYAAMTPPRARLRFGTSDELRARIARGVDAPAGEPRWWLEATRMADGAPVLVPLEYGQLASITTVAAPLVDADSTGMAVHVDRDAALSTARDELFERIGLVQICGGAGAEAAAPQLGLTSALASMGYAVRVLTTLVSSGAPGDAFTAAAVLLVRRPDAGPGPALIAGAGGGTAPEHAAKRALFEAYAQLQHALEIWPAPPRTGLPRRYDRFLHYHDPRAAKLLLAAWPVARVRPAPPGPLDLLVLDRGNAVTDALGLHAVHVIAPGAPVLGDATTVNTLPHPFA
jgi:ribosomal protein S12 methylthiotransferase accessory factor YcaO